MPRPGMLSQILLANLLLVAGAVVAGIVAANPDLGSDAPLMGLIIGLALSLTVGINFLLLQSRVAPLERLTQRMRTADLTSPRTMATLTDPPRGPREVVELQDAFEKMLTRIVAERRRASRAALAAGERERERVARDLHDEVNQALTGVLLRIEAARSHAPPALAGELAEVGHLADQAMGELLTLSRRLRPTVLDDLGLVAALSSLVDELDAGDGPQIELITGAEGRCGERLSAESQLVVYRVAQEALSNAVRHAEAQNVAVRLRRLGPLVELTVADDGAGIAPGSDPQGHGITGMRERALLVGGELTLGRSGAGGTRVRLTVPADERSAVLRPAPVSRPRGAHGVASTAGSGRSPRRERIGASA